MAGYIDSSKYGAVGEFIKSHTDEHAERQQR